MHALNLYVYGNVDFVYTVLTSTIFFMKHAMAFFKFAAVVCLLLFVAESSGVLPTKGYDWARFIRMYVILNIFIFTPYPGKVNLQDVITNKNYTFDFINGKLPIGLIVPISWASEVTNELIKLYQKNFEIDENLNYSYSGMNFGANFINSLDNANSYDDKFNYNLDNYMQNCGFPLLYKAGALSLLRTSQDIFGILGQYTSDARFVQQVDFSSGQPIIKVCSQAISEINSYYSSNQDKIMASNAQMMGINTSAGFDRYITAANATASQLLRITQGASAALKQAIGMNMIMASLKNSSQRAGNGTLALAAYDAEQFQQYKKAGELSGAASARTVPIMVATGFVLLLFLYPIMIFLAIALGSYRAIGTFFQILVAINLIPLLYEIINYMSTFYLEKKLGIVVTGQGFNYDISSSIYSFTDNMIIAVNWLSTLSPILALAIVTGSPNALTSVFSHINDPAKSQSQQTGSELAHGNMNMGNANLDNASYNNIQGNKLDNQVSMNTGVPIMKNTTPGGIQTNVGGQNYDINYKSDFLATPNFAQMATHSLENSLRHSQDQMNQLGKQWGMESRRAHDLSNTFGSGSNTSISIGADDVNNLRKAQELSTSISGELSGDFSVGKGLSAGAKLRGGLSSSSSSSLDHNLSEYKQVANELSHSSNKEISDAYSEASSLSDTTSHTMQDVVAKSQALSDVMSNQSAINTNLSNDFDKYLRANGYDPKEMSATAQTTMAQKFLDSNINHQYGINSSLKVPVSHISTKLTKPNLDSSGLMRPDSNEIDVQGQINNVYSAREKFEHHQGDTIGTQIKEQGKVLKNVGKDAADSITKLLKE